MPEPVPNEIRAARAFLYQHGITAGQVPPRRFAGAAKELGLPFRQLLHLLGNILNEGQGDERMSNLLDKEQLKEST